MAKKHDEDAAIKAREAVVRAERQADSRRQELTDRDCARLAESTYRRITRGERQP